MSGLTIGWEYLTGYAVATDPASRERAEWPPHPARVFMAMAAAWFQSGEDPAEGDALRWLESLGDPQLTLPSHEDVFPRANVTVYVPVNDKAGPSAATLQSAPALTRNKQSRSFPRVYVGNASCFMHWPDADVSPQRGAALAALCGKVTRIGHSSSLVRMWVVGDEEPDQIKAASYVVDDIHALFHARQISEGFLDTLIENYGDGPRKREGALNAEIEALKVERKSIKGKGAAERKAALDQRLEPLAMALDALITRAPVRPRVGLWRGYGRKEAGPARPVAHTYFDTDLLVLTRTAGPDLSLVSTLILTQALRGAAMKHAGLQPPPPWVSGHERNGERAESPSGHLACISLPFVGHEHADGHLLGLGFVFPRAVDRESRGQVLGALLLEPTRQPRAVELTLGRLGVWRLHKSDWAEQRGALQPETWTAHPNGATTWASVTPVVLDKFPKADRVNDRRAWRDEVSVIIAEACKRIGLPVPQRIDIGTTSWHRGSPRSIPKHRRLRGQPAPGQYADAPFGGGFPCFPAKGTRASRPQVHVWLHFAEPVVGPVLLGAGRFLGYGLCKPWKENAQ